MWRVHLNRIIIVLSIMVLMGAAHECLYAQEAGGEYVIGIGDVLDINVINEPGLKTSTIVASDGTIRFPYLGSIYVKGMKLSSLEKKIATDLSAGYIKYPVVAVSLLKSLSRVIYAYGEVGDPGRFEYVKSMTVQKALSMAKGIRPSSDYGIVRVRRKQKDNGYQEIASSKINEGIIENYDVRDLLLQPDDIIVVERGKLFYMQGEVSRPGQYALKIGTTVMKAISLAGGIMASGEYGEIKLRRRNKSTGEISYEEVASSRINGGTIEDSNVKDMIVEPDDIIVIRRNSTFYVNGEVARPGQFIWQSDMTVLKALSMAGGVSETGRYGKIVIKRKRDADKPGYMDISINLEDVAGTYRGGDTLIEPDDILIIGKNQTYFVNGEVMKPGEYMLKSGMTAFKAITIAGGFTKWGSGSRVHILRQKEGSEGFEKIRVDLKKVEKGDASYDIKLKANDIVVVSEGIL
jgi:polysaccharide export outer membrane protein